MGSYPHIHRLVHPLPGPYPLLPPPDLDKEGRVDNQRDTPPNTRLTVQPIRATSQFDIDRYLPGREEHKKRGSYAPFGLGTHTCLGSHWVELQLAVNLLLIARHFDIELRPADYRLRFNPFPTSKPSKKLQFAITALRHPIAAEAAAEQARESPVAASV